MNKAKKIHAYFLAAIFTVASTVNVHGGVWCIEAGGHAKVELICSPCCVDGSNQCTTGEPGVIEGDHAGCVDCSDFDLEILGRMQEISPEIGAGESETGAPPVLPRPFHAHSVVRGSCHGPPGIACGMGAVRASLEAVVLRC